MPLLMRWPLAASLVLSAQLAAQSSRSLADSSPAKILLLAKGPEVARVLRQRSKPQPRAKLDELADSLTGRIIRARDMGQSQNDLATLVEAGLGDSTLDGRPYTGAIDRLIRIHRESDSNSVVRRVALTRMVRVVGFARGDPYLRSVATSADVTADGAMTVLCMAANDSIPYPSVGREDRASMRAFLHQLWDTSDRAPYIPNGNKPMGKTTVQNPRAFQALYACALTMGWIK